MKIETSKHFTLTLDIHEAYWLRDLTQNHHVATSTESSTNKKMRECFFEHLRDAINQAS